MEINPSLQSSLIVESKSTADSEIQLIRIRTAIQELKLNSKTDTEKTIVSEVENLYEKLLKNNHQKQRYLDQMISFLINGLSNESTERTRAREIPEPIAPVEDASRTDASNTRKRDTLNKVGTGEKSDT